MVEFGPEKRQNVSYNKFEVNFCLHRQEGTAQQGLLVLKSFIKSTSSREVQQRNKTLAVAKDNLVLYMHLTAHTHGL